MKTTERMVLCLLGLLGSCAEPAPQVESAPSNDEPETLLVVDLGDEHTVEFIDFGNGARLVHEFAHAGVELRLPPGAAGSFESIYRQLGLEGDIPRVLLDADLAHPIVTPPPTPLTQKSSEAEWRNKLGGCACPYGTEQVKKICRPSTTGNFDDKAEAEWAWFNISHETGNGIDAFMTVDGKTTKRRYEPGDQSRMVGKGPDAFLGLDIDDVVMRLEIKGASGDQYHLGACWEID